MERILSKEEIQELLAAVRQGEIETGSAPVTKENGQTISRLDLVRLPGVERWQIPNLDLIFDSFGRNCAISLTNRLHRPVTVEPAGIESRGFEESVRRLGQSSAIGILDLDPFKAGGLLVVNGDLAFSLLEFQLGGAIEGAIKAPKRPLTALEMHLLRMVMHDCCTDLEKAFSPLEKVHPTLLKIENNPRLVNIVSASSGVLAARFNILLDHPAGTLELIIPHVSLEPLRERLRDSVLSISSLRGETWPQALLEGVNHIHTTISVQLAEVWLTVRDILNFQVGDIIEIGTGSRDAVEILVEDRRKFLGAAGSRNGNKAVRITEKIVRSE